MHDVNDVYASRRGGSSIDPIVALRAAQRRRVLGRILLEDRRNDRCQHREHVIDDLARDSLPYIGIHARALNLIEEVGGQAPLEECILVDRGGIEHGPGAGEERTALRRARRHLERLEFRHRAEVVASDIRDGVHLLSAELDAQLPLLLGFALAAAVVGILSAA